MSRIRVAVIGAGQFGRNHMRVIRASESAELAGIYDIDQAKAEAAAAEFGSVALTSLNGLAIDAAIVAVPTTVHAEVGCRLLEQGIDVLVEKPIASDLESARQLVEAAAKHQRILQVGHLERFNPAIIALEKRITIPLFFEIHRLSVFSPRSLDVDVVLDLMIHDIDILLALVKKEPEEIRAAGISILSEKVDIANVRIQFPGGCVANLTASRVSTERVRKMRVFQPHQYISLDYQKQEVVAFSVSPQRQIGFEPFVIEKKEPLALEIDSFLNSVTTRERPRVDGEEATRALAVSLEILAKIEDHARVIRESLP
jgi:predicted dehydrogenase